MKHKALLYIRSPELANPEHPTLHTESPTHTTETREVDYILNSETPKHAPKPTVIPPTILNPKHPSPNPKPPTPLYKSSTPPPPNPKP